MYINSSANINVGIETIAPGFIHCNNVTCTRFCLSSMPRATIFAVLPISVRFPKKVPANNNPHHNGETEVPGFSGSRLGLIIYGVKSKES